MESPHQTLPRRLARRARRAAGWAVRKITGSGRYAGGQIASAEYVRWAYRVLLAREADAKDVNDLVARKLSQTDQTLRLLRSLEFTLSDAGQRLIAENWHPQVGQHIGALAELLPNFKQYQGPGQDGFYMDFLGTRTRTSYVPGMHQYNNRTVGAPTEDRPLFDAAEWVGVLRSVLEARHQFVAIELGAGWGPWLVTCHAAARQRGITDIQLAGVEGSDAHYEYMVQHLTDNGIDPQRHFLFKGVVGVSDGNAYFPRLAEPQNDWGAQAVLQADPGEVAQRNFVDYRGIAFDQVDAVPSIALSTLLQRYPRIDVIHCDIQDAEGEVLPSAIGDMGERVRRVVAATHSRASEGALLAAFGANRWVIEADAPCRYAVDNGRTIALADGVQVWSNPRLAAP